MIPGFTPAARRSETVGTSPRQEARLCVRTLEAPATRIARRGAPGETPLRQFLRTETGSAAVVLSGAVAALVWVNVGATSYARVWGANLSIRIGGVGPSHDLRFWVNSGLMTFFFFVVGLRCDESSTWASCASGVGWPSLWRPGWVGSSFRSPVFLAFNAGRGSAGGWGITMSTDTAFVLGMLAVGTGIPDRLRIFMLTVSIVDDVVALLVIATVYSTGVRTVPLVIGLAVCAVIVLAVSIGIHRGLLYAALGVAGWVAFSELGDRSHRDRPGHGPADAGRPGRPW